MMGTNRVSPEVEEGRVKSFRLEELETDKLARAAIAEMDRGARVEVEIPKGTWMLHHTGGGMPAGSDMNLPLHRVLWDSSGKRPLGVVLQGIGSYGYTIYFDEAEEGKGE